MAESDMCPTCHASTKGLQADASARTYFNETCSKECARAERLLVLLDHIWVALQKISGQR